MIEEQSVRMVKMAAETFAALMAAIGPAIAAELTKSLIELSFATAQIAAQGEDEV